MSTESFETCPSCGYVGVEPVNESGGSTFEICPCCGIEYGYGDATLEGLICHRQQWIAEGARWFDPKERPEHWSLEQQLANIPERFR